MPEVAVRLRGLVLLGLVLRLGAALAVEMFAQRLGERRGTRCLCLFPDTDLYWQLGTALARGEPFVVSQWGVPHFALRTPGYPLFLAACQWAFGDATLPARLVQAVLGAACVPLVYRLAGRVLPAGGSAAWAAAVLTACDPWTVGLSALLLSEALFLPLMLLGLWGLAVLWNGARPARPALTAFGVGLAWGAAVLVKPSWLLFPPLALLAWAIHARPRRPALTGAVLVLLGISGAMAPWWWRNGTLYGRFVPTALWMGASLYDGLNPAATGASDMRFLEAPQWRALAEPDQDAVLTRAAADFVWRHPGRAAWLAVVKAGRFWSPWPNAENLRSLAATLAATAATLPVLVLMLLGAWECRHDPRALALLGGPVLYFAALHMVFVSSVRYRLPGMVAAFGLAGAAWSRWRGGQ